MFEQLAAELVLDSSGFSRGVNQAEDDLSGLEKSTSRARENIAKMGAVAAGVGAVGLAASAKAASDYQSAMTEVAKVTSEATAEQLNSSLLELSKTIPLSATALADLAEQAGRFGIKGTKNIQNFVETTAKMAEATDLSADKAGEAFAKLATLTETPISKMENLGSSINTLSNNMATSSQEIVDSMLRSSGALSQLGASNTEIIALSGTLNAVSSSSERAGSRLRRLAQEIAVPKDKIAEMAKGIGVTIGEFKRMRSNDPTGLIRKMAQSMYEGGRQAQLLGEAFSTTSRQALSGLGSNLQGLDTAMKSANQSFKSATSLQEEFDAAVQTTAAQARLLKNEIMAVAITTGQQLLPFVKSAIGAIRGLVSTFSEWNSATNGMAGVLVGLVSIVGGLATAFAALSPQIMSAVGTMSSLAPTIAAIAGPAAVATAAVIALATAVATNFGGIRDDIQSVASVLSSEFAARWMEARNLVVGIANDIADAFGITSSAIEGAVGRISTAVSTTLISGIQAASAAVEAGLDLIEEGWKAHGDVVIGTIETIVQRATTIYGQLQQQVGAAVSQLQNLIAVALTRIEAVWAEHGATVQAAAIGAYQRVATVVGQAAERIRTIVGAAVARIETLWTQHGQTIQTAVITAYTTLQTLVANAVGAIEAIWQRHGQAIQTQVVGAYQILRTQVGAAVGAVRQTITEATARIEELWATHGQRLITTIIGTYQSVRASVAEAVAAVQQTISAAVARIDEVWNAHGQTIITTIIGAYQSLRTGIVEVLATVRQTVSDVVTRMGELWNAHGQTIITTVIGAYQSLRTRIAEAIAAVQQAISAAVTRIEELWNAHGQTLLTTVIGAYQSLQTRVSEAVALIQQTVTEVVTRIEELWATHGQTIQTTLVTAYQALREGIGVAVGAVRQLITEVVTRIEELWGQHGQTIQTQVVDYYRTLREQVGVALDGLRTAVETAVTFLSQQWDSFATTIAETVGPIVEDLQSLGEQFGFLDEKGRPTAETLTKVALAIASLVNPIPAVINAFLTLKTAWDNNIGGIQTSANEIFPQIRTVITETMAGIATAVSEALTRIQTFWQTTLRPLIQRTVEIFTQIGQAVYNGLQWIYTNAVVPILNSILQLWQIHGQELLAEVVETYEVLKQGISTVLNAILPIIKVFVGAALVAIQTFVNQATAFWNAWGSEILAVTKFIFDLVGSVITAALDVILTGIRVTLNLIQGDWGEALNALLELARRIFTGIINFIKKWGSGLISYIGNTLIPGIINWFKELYNRLIGNSIIPEMLSAIQQAFATFITNVIQQIQQWVTTVIQRVIALKDQFIQTVTALKDRVVQLVTTLRDRVVQLVTTLRDRAVQLATALRDRAVDLFTTLKDRVVDLATTLKDRVVELITTLKDRGVELLTTFKDRAVELFTTAKDRATELMGTLKENIFGVFQDILSDLEQFASDFVTGIENMVTDAANFIKNRGASAFSSAFGKLADAAKNGFNNAMPSSVSIPSVTVAGETFGGGSIDLPRLNTGGFIEKTGLFVGHAGERVLNPAETRRYESNSGGGGSSGGGGDTYHFEFSDGAIIVEGGEDPKKQAREILSELKKLEDRDLNKFLTST